MLSEVLIIAQKLISMPSVSPDDGGTLEYISQYLIALGFEMEMFEIGEVKTLYAKYGKGPYCCFAGHVDVVPPGPDWQDDPYCASIIGDSLYGRGTADMKVAIACAMVAVKEALNNFKEYSFAFLLTRDEEAAAQDGIKKVSRILKERNEDIRVFLLGEPTFENEILDTVKIGRRGSVTSKLKIVGQQGHIAYPHLAFNPIHNAIELLKDLMNLDFNDYIENFGSSKLQITNVDSFNSAMNVIPGTLEISFGVRFNSSQTEYSIKNKILTLIEKYGLSYEIVWYFHGNAFITQDEKILTWLQNSISKFGIQTKFDAKGATSDGRFLHDIAPVVELGFAENMAHKKDESVLIKDIEKLFFVYNNLFQDYSSLF